MSARDRSRGRQPYRTSSGGVIDRNRTLRFTFDGATYVGHPGDTIASALLANGVRLCGRSFKYHRPRGVLTAGSEEPNALCELRTGARREANTRMTVAELYDGLTAVSQNRWPSLNFDLMSVNSLLSPIFVAGFYYKTFMWPASFWEKYYEPLIRRAAGLGRAAATSDPDTYEKVTAFCDVLVIGAGPAGLMAASQAAKAGARVILAEENAGLGGRLIDDGRKVGAAPGAQYVDALRRELAANPDVRILTRTCVFGVYDGGTYGAIERVNDHRATPPAGAPRQRLWRIAAKRAVLAAGAIERPIAFAGNDRPGVMLAGAVRSYIHRFGVVPGRRAIVFVNGDDAASTALSLDRAGANIAAIVDSRPGSTPTVRAIAESCRAPLFAGAMITEAIGAKGVTAASIRTADGRTATMHGDLIAVSGGWNPTIQLTTHLGGTPKWDVRIAAFTAGALPHGMAVVGAASGAMTLADALSSGAAAGAQAAQSLGLHVGTPTISSVEPEDDTSTPLWRVPDVNGKAFVDFQNDVTTSDIELAAREGFRAVEHLKRYTTIGMATDQGKTANVNALAIMAEITGRSIPETGVTKARPPFTPVAIGAFAGHHRGRDFKPTRLPPSYAWAKEQGAQFVETGLWLRPGHFPMPGERDWLQTVIRETTAVRSAVGVCDVSTLGKIDVQGADALEFLEHIYMNNLATLSVGKARYGVMLREDGVVFDDGTVARFDESHFFVTTTTANAARVLQHMEFCHQWHWPHLDVRMASATDHWAQYAVAGPKSRDLLRLIVDDAFDISDAAIPYMAAAEITICGGVKARLYRLSFSGERAFEIGIPARYGDALWRQLMSVGAPLGVTAYGSETLGVMRVEKGHVSGPELNGTTTARDLGLAGMASKKKDYVGRVLALRPGMVDPDRPALVGVTPVEGNRRLRAGAHFIARGADATAPNDEGYVTSAVFSATLGRWIGLGLLKRGPERHGEFIRMVDLLRGEDFEVEVTSPVFFDPMGERLRG
ncbi:MAG: sarcosine oxidase subunit alpha family protein [Hyphomicrobium sp.]